MGNDEIHNGSGAEPRVYKSSEVHKRRTVKPSEKVEAPAATPATAPATAPAPDEASAPASAEAPAAEPVQEAPQPEPQPAVDSQPAPESSSPAQPTPRRATRPSAAPLSQPVARPRRPRVGAQIAGIFAAALAAVLLMFAGYYAASRWIVFDDRAGIQGTWFIAGTSVPVSITEDTIALDLTTSYRYEIDTTAKTLTYRFGDLEGQGHYWFSSDRRYLVISDGENLNMWTTLFDDLGHSLHDFYDDMFNGGAKLPSGDNLTVLSTTPTLNLDSASSTVGEPVEDLEPESALDATEDTAEPAAEPTAESPSASTTESATEEEE